MAKSARILVIEDDEVIARTVQSALRDEGFQVDVVACLKDARRSMLRQRHAAVVLDLDLPDGAGELLLLDIARSEVPSAAVVMSAREYAPRVASRWAIPYVQKPFELDELIAAVKVATEVSLVPRPFRASLV
jgi:DNA-binding response OmpR family regulator